MNLNLYRKLKKNYELSQSKKDLDELRLFLDINGYKMPQPLYNYNEKDKSTWKYLGVNVNRSKISGKIECSEILNPRFSPKRNV